MEEAATSDSLQVRVEPATLEDLDQLVSFVMELLELENDFAPDRRRQEHGLRLILEQPNRGRIFVVRNDHAIVGMVNLLFTISTAAGVDRVCVALVVGACCCGCVCRGRRHRCCKSCDCRLLLSTAPAPLALLLLRSVLLLRQRLMGL